VPYRFNVFSGNLDYYKDPDLSAYATKEYVDSGTWLMPPIIEWYDPTGGLPADPEIGDRYGADATANGWTIDYIYEWDGEEWLESEPEEGWMLWNLWEMIMWVFFSGGWMEMGEDSYLKLDGTNSPSADIYSSYAFIMRSFGISGPEGDGLVTFTLAGAYTANVTVPTSDGKLALQTDIPSFEEDPIFSAWLIATPPLYEETDPIFSAWDKSTGISITESQISDLQTYYKSGDSPSFGAITGTGFTMLASNVSIPNYDFSDGMNYWSTDSTWIIATPPGESGDWAHNDGTINKYLQPNPALTIVAGHIYTLTWTQWDDYDDDTYGLSISCGGQTFNQTGSPRVYTWTFSALTTTNLKFWDTFGYEVFLDNITLTDEGPIVAGAITTKYITGNNSDGTIRICSGLDLYPTSQTLTIPATGEMRFKTLIWEPVDDSYPVMEFWSGSYGASQALVKHSDTYNLAQSGFNYPAFGYASTGTNLFAFYSRVYAETPYDVLKMTIAYATGTYDNYIGGNNLVGGMITNIVTASQYRLRALNTAPANASATGTLGEIRIDANYIYVCTATNTWKRVAIATW
jgi:hypothetical protein